MAFQRPSTRRRSAPEQIMLNLVPILDTLVALLSFMLLTTAFLSIVSVESPFPETSAKQLQELEKKEKPLQLTLSLREKDAEIWSPFDRIAPIRLANTPEGQADLKAIHEALVTVKQKFPNELKIVLVPYGGVSYDVLVSVMDSVRMMEPTDPPIFTKNAASGVDEAVKRLFPDVIFGNLLGGGG